jgi:tetratricopeptide (TPR) repeat protein
MSTPQIVRHADAKALAEDVALRLVDEIVRAEADKRTFHLVLTGGGIGIADALLREGALYAAQGDTERALAAFEDARAARPGDAGIIGRIGFQQFRAGRLQEAIASYSEATRLRPNDAGLWASLGGIYLNVGRNQEALEAFERSLAIEPRALAYYNHGVLLFYLRDYAGAATSLRSALRLENGDFRTWGALGAALLADASTAATAVEPFRRATASLTGWVTGRRRDQAATRANLPVIETGEKIRVNPLVNWTRKDIWSFIMDNGLPYNPLHDRGYASIGDAPLPTLRAFTRPHDTLAVPVPPGTKTIRH